MKDAMVKKWIVFRMLTLVAMASKKLEERKEANKLMEFPWPPIQGTFRRFANTR